jgi:hypothetical protein
MQPGGMQGGSHAHKAVADSPARAVVRRSMVGVQATLAASGDNSQGTGMLAQAGECEEGCCGETPRAAGSPCLAGGSAPATAHTTVARECKQGSCVPPPRQHPSVTCDILTQPPALMSSGLQAARQHM